jgi:hypothetical protein
MVSLWYADFGHVIRSAKMHLNNYGDIVLMLPEGRFVSLGNATGYPSWMALSPTKCLLKCSDDPPTEKTRLWIQPLTAAPLKQKDFYA